MPGIERTSTAPARCCFRDRANATALRVRCGFRFSARARAGYRWWMHWRMAAVGCAVGTALAACGGDPGAVAPRSPAAPQNVGPAARCTMQPAASLTVDWTVPDACIDEDASSPACKAACDAHDADACLARAYELEAAHQEAASRAAYGRACELGRAIACTNWGAHVWLRAQAPRTCYLGAFEQACAAGEAYGCMMVGRVLTEEPEAPGDRARGMVLLEEQCRTAAGISCRMLAYMLELGHGGTPDTSRSAALLQRACDLGDQLACRHTTATPTIRDPD